MPILGHGQRDFPGLAVPACLAPFSNPFPIFEHGQLPTGISRAYRAGMPGPFFPYSKMGNGNFPGLPCRHAWAPFLTLSSFYKAKKLALLAT